MIYLKAQPVQGCLLSRLFIDDDHACAFLLDTSGFIVVLHAIFYFFVCTMDPQRVTKGNHNPDDDRH